MVIHIPSTSIWGILSSSLGKWSLAKELWLFYFKYKCRVLHRIYNYRGRAVFQLKGGTRRFGTPLVWCASLLVFMLCPTCLAFFTDQYCRLFATAIMYGCGGSEMRLVVGRCRVLLHCIVGGVAFTDLWLFLDNKVRPLPATKLAALLEQAKVQ